MINSSSSPSSSGLPPGSSIRSHVVPLAKEESDATTATMSHQHHADTNPPADLPRWYPNWKGKPLYNGNQEALGWAIDSIGRAVLAGAIGAFLVAALLRLAKLQAGCEVDPPEGSNKVPPCNGKAYGLKPSSLITTLSSLVGLFSAIIIPFFGAVVDYTSHRRLIGRWASAAICILIFPQIFVDENTWYPLVYLLLLTGFFVWGQTMVTYAYLPELADSEERLADLTRTFTVASFGTIVIYLILIIAVAHAAGFGDDVIATARLAVAVAFVISSICFYLSWGTLLKRRPPMHELSPGQSVVTAGFIQVYRTALIINRSWHALKWFYISVVFNDSGLNSLVTIMVTYFTDTLAFDTVDTGIAIFCVFFGAVPGGLVSARAFKRMRTPVHSNIAATSIVAVNTVLASLFLKGAGQKRLTFLFCIIWGFGSGWKWTTDRVMASAMIPDGQDAELMGFYLFAGQVFTWVPQVLFTGLNEAGVSERALLGGLSSLFFVGIACLTQVTGKYHAAVVDAKRLRPLERGNHASSSNAQNGHDTEVNGNGMVELAEQAEDKVPPDG